MLKRYELSDWCQDVGISSGGSKEDLACRLVTRVQPRYRDVDKDRLVDMVEAEGLNVARGASRAELTHILLQHQPGRPELYLQKSQADDKVKGLLSSREIQHDQSRQYTRMVSASC